MSFKMAFVFCSLYCMGVQRRKLNRTGKETTANSSLKKLAVPKKNKPVKKNASADIVIDLKIDKKNYDSDLELVLRKLSQSSKSPMPGDLKPMLATLSDEAFNDAAWQFELKLDGYRTLAYLKMGKV